MAFDPRVHNVEDLLEMPSNKLPEPPKYPTLVEGQYYGLVMSQSIDDSPWNPETLKALSLTVGLTRPGEGVPESAMEGIDLSDIRLRPKTWEMTPRFILGVLKTILDSMDIDPRLSTLARIAEMQGKEVLCGITAKPSDRQGDTRVFNNIGTVIGTAKKLADVGQLTPAKIARK